MKTIEISTDTYARIWGIRREGEETEDQILRRLLLTTGLGSAPLSAINLRIQESLQQADGYEDLKSGIKFAESEEIFRTYKGKDYRARATHGFWILQNNRSAYPSLHKLSWEVVSGHENAWNNWKITRNGKTQIISALRPANKIQTRVRILEGFNLENLDFSGPEK